MEKYEVLIVGYDEDDNPNDFEQLEGTFEDEDKAIWFAENYPFSAPSKDITPHSKVIVEGRNDDDFVSLIYESELS